MKLKKKLLALAVIGSLAFGAGSCFNTPSTEVYDSTGVVSKVEAATLKTTSIPLITDNTNSVLAKADISSLEEEQTRIHKDGEVAVKYNFYSYIYEDDTPAEKKAKEIADNYSKIGEAVPFILVLNKQDNSFHFIEDTKLTPYTSAAYLANLAEKMFKVGVTPEGVKEFVIRADSTLMMSVDGDFAFTGQIPINAEASKKFVTVQNFGDSANVGKHVEQKNKTTENTDENKAEAEDNSMLLGVLTLVLAGGTIAFFVKKRRGRK